jgi:hypothetical protein
VTTTTSSDPVTAEAHSILPLAVLEAIRRLDSPSDEEVAEYVDELLKKRLGLSDTVAAQIARYESLVKRDGTVSAFELEQIFRLVGRRTDAALAFADSGRRAARRGMTRLSGLSRWSSRQLPRGIRRSIGFRAARSVAGEVFGLALVRDGKDAVASLSHEVAVRATPDGSACGFYAAGLAELLRQLVDFEGTIAHPACRSRGEPRCEWRTSGGLERGR